MNQPNPFGAGGFKLDGTLYRTATDRDHESPPKKQPRRPFLKHDRHNQSGPVIPPPDGKNNREDYDKNDGPDIGELPDGAIVITNCPPLRSRIARLVAWTNLILGVIYASSLVFRLLDYFIGNGTEIPSNLPLAILGLLIIAPIAYVVLQNVIAGCIEAANDILIGIVDAWPEPLGLPQFFDQLETEAALDIAKTVLHDVGLPEIAAVIPQRPRLGSTARSLLYMATYFACFFYTPAADLIKNIFWKAEGLLGILFLAYVLTNFRAYREQYHP